MRDTREPMGRVSFATPKDVGNYPFRRGPTSQGVDEFRQSSAMVQCALSSRSPGDENDSAGGVKPETKNVPYGERYDKNVRFFSPDNHVVDPLERGRS
jgi:hypothetical protein